MFRPSTNILVIILCIVSGVACLSLWCHMSKVTAHLLVSVTNAVGVSGLVSTAYRWPHRLAVMTTVPLAVLSCAPCSSNLTLILFSASFETEIKLERSSGVCSASSKVMTLLMPLMVVSILAFPFPATLKVDSLPVASPMVGQHSGVSDRNEFSLTKQ